jgi:hypothetical protein|tara:strand:+ start:284 stop:985 length:702 start_codon:yes stop_codon:yes gene_type:complete
VVCSSGVGFDPVIEGTRYTFDVAGLYNGLFVMSDRQTGSVWTHYDGTILTGPLAGTGAALTVRPLFHQRWSDWLAAHPETLVLAREERYEDRYWETTPGRPGLGREFLDTLISLDTRLPENDLVLGVDTGTASRAYRLAGADGPMVVADVLGGVPVIALLDPDSVFGIAFEATVGGQLRSFQPAPGGLVDDLGGLWGFDGSGSGGRSLNFVTSFVTEWYGWAAYHPDTGIWPG